MSCWNISCGNPGDEASPSWSQLDDDDNRRVDHAAYNQADCKRKTASATPASGFHPGRIAGMLPSAVVIKEPITAIPTVMAEDKVAGPWAMLKATPEECAGPR